MAEILVTGANGFIGSHLIPALLARGHRVTGLVRPTSDVSSLVPLIAASDGRLSLVLGDVREPAAFAASMARAEYVYHLAGVLMGSSEAEFRDTNVEGTRRVTDQLLKLRHPQFKRLLVTSSLAAAGPSPTAAPIDETVPTHPVSWYGKSKADVEVIVNAAGAKGLPVSMVRPVSVYGEREQDLSRSMYPMVSLGLRPRIRLSATTLTMVYVGDLVEGMIAVAEGAASLGKTYFLADPVPARDSDITDAVAAALGKNFLIPIITPPFALQPMAIVSEWLRMFVRGRPMATRDKLREVSQQFWSASPAAAQRDVGWTAKVSLKDGMVRAVGEWQQRGKDAKSVSRLLGDRLVMTYSLAVAFGVLVESTAFLGKWYTFDPWWLIFVIIFGAFGGLMGTLTYLLNRAPMLVQFLAGAAVGFSMEMANGLWWHRWEFSEMIMRRLPDLVPRCIVLGLPAGLLPVVITTLLYALNRQRGRIG